MPRPQAGPTEPPISFRTVVCGIDSSPQSVEAARQALELADDGARAWAVAVWDPGEAIYAGIHASEAAVDLREQAVTALRDVREQVPELTPMLVRGGDVAGLLAAATNLEADLVAVGAHGRSRVAGIVLGSVATAMVHYAPCSVLVARERGRAERPAVILHANDGSPGALDAAQAAGLVAARTGAATTVLHVGDDPDRGEEIAREVADGTLEAQARVVTGSPHERIVEVAEEIGASLVVLGSRGLTGLKALGSVSERVAHRAPCSVLVVRRPVIPAEEELGEG